MGMALPACDGLWVAVTALERVWSSNKNSYESSSSLGIDSKIQMLGKEQMRQERIEEATKCSKKKKKVAPEMCDEQVSVQKKAHIQRNYQVRDSKYA